MKIINLALSLFTGSILIFSCNNGSSSSNAQQSPGLDTTSTNPTSNAQDYHPDQRQTIPVTDSSNVVGTDTINSSTATPNTGTNKSFNDAKGNKDSTKKHK